VAFFVFTGKGAKAMSQDAKRKEFAAATRDWVEKSRALNHWYEEHIAFWWPESGQPAPPEPKVVNREALDELEKLRADEQKAKDKWARINRQLLGLE
jgi:hypothetical protein